MPTEQPPTDLLWVVVETTGFNPAAGWLLEVAMAVTTPDLDIRTRASWTIGYRSMSIERMRAESDPWVREHHDASGLWQECSGGDVAYMDTATTWTQGSDVATRIESWVRTTAPGLPLAGSSVHFDRAWLNAWMPHVIQLVGYRNVDISTIKELLARWAPHLEAGRPKPQALHRAAPDIDDSIAELAYYRTALGLNTTEAVDAVAEIHHRHAVIRQQDAYADTLRGRLMDTGMSVEDVTSKLLRFAQGGIVTVHQEAKAK